MFAKKPAAVPKRRRKKPEFRVDKSVDRAGRGSQKCSASAVFLRRIRSGQTALFVTRPREIAPVTRRSPSGNDNLVQRASSAREGGARQRATTTADALP